MKKKKRLTDAEIREAVEKIRKRYADYMVMYQKPRNALDAFEERYLSVLRARMELSLFLHAEKNVIEQLIQKEEDRRRKDEEEAEKKKQSRAQQQSVADRVMEKHRQQIEKYPRIKIHDDAAEEIERLFGALGALEREYWNDLERLIRKTFPNALVSPRQRVEEQMLRLCGAGFSDVPPRLSRYRSLFDWFPRNYREIEKEGNKCILESAFFLHDLLDVGTKIAKSEELNAEELARVEKMLEYVHTVIDDFRLKDFKKGKR